MRNISSFFRSVVKSLAVVVFLSFTFISSSFAQNAVEGKALFKANCSSCHALANKVVGPALSGVTGRHKEEWLLKWIKNSRAMIDAGDPEAVKIYNEYKPAVMTSFPALTDENIKDILAYTDKGDAPASGGDKVSPESTAANDEISGLTIAGIVLVVLIALFVILILNRVIKALERVLLKNQGVEVAEEAESGERFATLKRLSKNKKFVFFTIILVVIVLSSVATVEMWNTGVHTGYQPEQPIKFSHQLHAGINKIDCRYCHSGAYKSKNASIPSLNVCMNCHNYVTASEKYDGQVSPEIKKIYEALDYNPDTKVYGENKIPVKWIRIHNLPDFAYFNHSQHVVVAGVKCQKCHGPVETMAEVYQASPLTMKWCINCHRETEVKGKGNAYYDRLIAAHNKDEKLTAAVMGGTECGKCHY